MGTNTGIGIGVGIPFKNNALGGDRPYLPPELKARLIGVWDNYGKKNTDADRNIIKNKIPNAGGDLEILNAAYEGMSGYNGYPVIFGINKTWKNVPTYNSIYSINDNKIHITKVLGANRGLIFSYVKQNDQLYDITEIPSFKIRVSGLKGDSKVRYSYIKTENAVYQTLLDLDNGIHELPKSLAPTNSISNNSWIGFTISPRIENETSFDCDITIEILPEYEGAFVTDGVNDMIISQKTLQEMGVTKDFTIVSMIHQISYRGSASVPLTNYIRRPKTSQYVRNHVSNIGKTGIYGYVCYDISNSGAGNSHVVNTILGDKNDYSINIVGNLSQGKFSVQGYIDGNGNIRETTSVAHYWTFAVLGKATEDDINLIIGYFDLDRTLKADIYYNIERQGITNDNHAEFNDKLIDYSGNGRDLQLFNIGWKGESGVGRYTEEFKNDYWLVHKDQTGIIKDGNSIKVVGKLSNYYIVYHSKLKATNGFKVKIKGIKTEIIYNYISSDKEQSISFKEDGIYDIPASEAVDSTFTLGFYFRFNDINLDWIGLTIEIIPSNKGALCLDGINDFGKVINMPIYKDYTFIVDREILSIDNIGIIASKSESAEDATKHGAFIFEYLTAPNIINTWSYYKNNTNIANTDFIRGISYQSKYNYNGKDLIIGTSKDSDKLYLGTIRDNSDKYGNIAIYFLMSFPYSMNKFLIERQLKKYKAGTLYKDMVEFRPVIKSNIDIKNIVYLDKDSNVIKVGDYISIGSNIKTSITVLDGYKISKVSSTAFNNITIEKSNTDFIYDVIFYGIKKSPQKINLVIEQDSDYVQWNPNIKANVSKYSVTANIRETDGTTLKLVNGQFYSTSITGNLILDIVPPYKDSDEVTNVVIDGKSYVPTKDSSGNYYRLEIPLVFPKEINITIQEYVRYEDIVQPYPVLLRFKDENNNEISWGDKIKLGSSITRIGSFNDCNLLKDIYTVSNAKLNGNPLPSTPHVVERQMVFTCKATWIFDDNEPNCILSPRLLRIPNSSYKILRHIPDISGHGNHGAIYNSAYAEGSGVNEDGSYQFDGVNDFVAIPTLSSGGKQVLMKVNWDKTIADAILYDQRGYPNEFAIYNADVDNNNNPVFAYQARNNGQTYIDGILNKNIKASELRAITHNITITNELSTGTNTSSPVIGSNRVHDAYFTNMALYDFMLFDDISTDDKIKQLNEYVGIEAKVELPPYYWDAYGKTNLDADKATIQQRGVAVGDYDITNYNHAYEGMSGYNGYPVVFGANKTWANESNGYVTSITSNTIHITNVLNAGLALLYSYVKYNGNLQNIKEIPSFKIEIKGLEGRSKFIYKYLATSDATKETNLYLGNGTHELPKSFLPTEALINNAVVGFSISPIEEGVTNFLSDITIEVLPEYENGLAYDGVSDFTDNKNIPILTDFTFIIKREILGLETNESMLVIKGDKVYNNGIGNAFILEHNSNGVNYVYSYGKLNQIKRDDSKIIYLTPESYNGNPIIKGENGDNLGLILSRRWRGIIYKTILYSKTISLLEINFLKNLMEKDEIIDLNNPIFIKNE